VFVPSEYLRWDFSSTSSVYGSFWEGPRKRLYFHSYREAYQGQDSVFDSDIWYSDWLDTGWTADQKLGPQINSPYRSEWSPSVSPDGMKLYFVAPDSASQSDVWVSTFDSITGDWGVPVNLGAPVNTPQREISARLAPDGRLFFTSDFVPPFRIYASQWNGASWSVPELQWSGGSRPIQPSVSADSQWLFFADVANVYVARRTDSGWEAPAYPLFEAYWFHWFDGPFVSPSGDSLFYTLWWDDGTFDLLLARRRARGDANLDGALSGADVVAELNKVFVTGAYWSFTYPDWTGDMDCDRLFTPSDAVRLLNVIYLGANGECWSSIPPPRPE
jgi:hypothetical protein